MVKRMRGFAPLALVCLMNLPGCFLPPPGHRTALVMNGAVAVIGLGLIATSSSGRGENNGPGAADLGGLFILGAGVMSIVTLIGASVLPDVRPASQTPPARPRPVALSLGMSQEVSQGVVERGVDGVARSATASSEQSLMQRTFNE